MPLTRGTVWDTEGGISARPSTGRISVNLGTHSHTHSNLDRQSKTVMSLSCRPAVGLLICWCVYHVLTNKLFTSPGGPHSSWRPSLSPSSSDCIRGLNLPHLSLVLLYVVQHPPPLPLSAPLPQFSSRFPAIASSCGPHRARSLALTWQVPGLRTTASTNTFPTWGTKRRRWVLWGGLCLCVWCIMLSFVYVHMLESRKWHTNNGNVCEVKRTNPNCLIDNIIDKNKSNT